MGASSATATLNLRAGGLLVCDEIRNFGSASQVVNFYGGTLKAIANNASFMTGLTSANIYTGLTVDTTNVNITIGQRLLGAGPGGLTKVGTGILTLSGANTYTGNTVVGSGTLNLTGSLSGGGKVTVASGATLTGSGTILGSVSVASGATLAPGAGSIGTLTIPNSLTFSNDSSADFEVNLNGGLTNNEQVVGLTSVAYAGTLVVTNTGTNTLAVGDQFHLFTATTASGNFSSVTVLPQGTGTFDPATGVLTITPPGAFTIHVPVISAGNLILTGTGGTADGSYTVLTTTNVATPLADWETNATGTFDSLGAFSNDIPLNAAEPGRFFNVRIP